LTFAVGLDPAPRAYLAPTKKGAAFGQRFDVIEPASVPGSYLRFYLVDTDRIAPEGVWGFIPENPFADECFSRASYCGVSLATALKARAATSIFRMMLNIFSKPPFRQSPAGH
jgi:hypothetical protein